MSAPFRLSEPPLAVRSISVSPASTTALSMSMLEPATSPRRTKLLGGVFSPHSQLSPCKLKSAVASAKERPLPANAILPVNSPSKSSNGGRSVSPSVAVSVSAAIGSTSGFASKNAEKLSNFSRKESSSGSPTACVPRSIADPAFSSALPSPNALKSIACTSGTKSSARPSTTLSSPW